jgi:hypothetical protein
MKPGYYLIMAISISFALCISGFLVMNAEFLLTHIARDPPPTSWYLGAIGFLLGVVSYVLTLMIAKKSCRKQKIGIVTKMFWY